MSTHTRRAVAISSGLTAIALVAGCGGPRPPEIQFVAGLGATDMQGEGGFVPAIDGPEFSGRLSVGGDGALADTDGNGSGPRLGGRIGFTYTQQDFRSRNVAGEPLLEIDDFIGLSLVTPQLVFSYRQMLGGDADFGGLFLEPGIGGGLAIGTLSFGSEFEFGNDPIGRDISDYETELSFGVQPFLRFGYDSGSLLVGAEGGYLWTGLNFEDDLGRDVDEWYVGFFLGVKLQ